MWRGATCEARQGLGDEPNGSGLLTLLCTIPGAAPVPPPPNLAVWRAGDTCWEGWERQCRLGPLLLRPRPPCPAWVPPPWRPPAEQRERTATRGAHRCRSAQLGTPRREPSQGRGHRRGGRSRGRAVETQGAAGRSRLVSEAAGCWEP